MKVLQRISELPGDFFEWFMCKMFPDFEGDPDDGPMRVEACKCGTTHCWTSGREGFPLGWNPPECPICKQQRLTEEQENIYGDGI